MITDSTNELPRGRQRIEVITSVQRRRRWSQGQKKQMVEETFDIGSSVSEVARRHGIAPSQLFYWKRTMEQGALTAVGSDEKLIPESEFKKLEERTKRLERLLGQKTEEIEVLKDAIKIAREKKLISRRPLQGSSDTE